MRVFCLICLFMIWTGLRPGRRMFAGRKTGRPGRWHSSTVLETCQRSLCASKTATQLIRSKIDDRRAAPRGTSREKASPSQCAPSRSSPSRWERPTAPRRREAVRRAHREGEYRDRAHCCAPLAFSLLPRLVVTVSGFARLTPVVYFRANELRYVLLAHRLPRFQGAVLLCHRRPRTACVPPCERTSPMDASRSPGMNRAEA